MSRGNWTWGIWLLAVVKLAWAKLPGPSQTRRSFILRKREDEGGIEVIDSHGQISQFFSGRTSGITVQAVDPLLGGRYRAGSGILRSRVRVEVTEPDTAKLRGLAPDVESLLTSGSGQIVIVTGVVKEGRLQAQNAFMGKGTGTGTWEIRLWGK